jgi:hypothetical protein
MNIDNFPAYVAIEFDSKCKNDIKNWLNSRITFSKENNGAELITLFSSNSQNEV